MPRRPAQITQADVARIIRAAKQAGVSEVVVKVGEQSVIVSRARKAPGRRPLLPPARLGRQFLRIDPTIGDPRARVIG
jgi:hypothetical protein